MFTEKKSLRLSSIKKIKLPALPKSHRILYVIAAVFMLILSISYSIAPIVKAKNTLIPITYNHWLGFFIWTIGFGFAVFFIYQTDQKTHSVLLPLASIFSGWGLLTIWRITPNLGIKQSIWLIISLAILVIGYRSRDKFFILRKYKYIWLFSGLLLTASTLLFGTNPNSYGPNLWLGCCGIYFQPSEPLKLLLILYLAAYFADRQPFLDKTIQLIFPTLFIFGIALILLVVQRDLGTAAIFLFIYTTMIYITTNKKRVLIIGLLAICAAALLGYSLFDVVQVRVEAWLDPWADPSGNSYQIVQSLIAIAAGGMTGRGPGMGYPNLVPISFSDFIFSAIAEEFGLPGTLGLILALIIFTQRGFSISIYAKNKYEQLLAIGITSYIAAQSLLIIGGNIRLLPLTGVTLPFFSYGGSSLTTTFSALLFLIIIDANTDSSPARITNQQSIKFILLFLTSGLVLASILNSWWALWRGPDLLTRTDNARRSTANQYSQRGTIFDRNLNALNEYKEISGFDSRIYNYPEVNPVLGYIDNFYGQAGAEASLDPILRGLENSDVWITWSNHLLYGQSPPGFDVVTSLDINLQQTTAKYLRQTPGAVVLLDAITGQILVMYSSPYYDANNLEVDWDKLSSQPSSPFLNRATQSKYYPGPSLGLFWMPEFHLYEENLSNNIPMSTRVGSNIILNCTELRSTQLTWAEIIKAGCPGPVETLAQEISEESINEFFARLKFYEIPEIRLPVAQPSQNSLPLIKSTAIIGQSDVQVSPLQMALAAAAISNDGEMPSPHFVLYSLSPKREITEDSRSQTSEKIFTKAEANKTAYSLQQGSSQKWSITSYAVTDTKEIITWHIAGTLPNAERPLVLVVLLESDNPQLAKTIANILLTLAQK